MYFELLNVLLICAFYNSTLWALHQRFSLVIELSLIFEIFLNLAFNFLPTYSNRVGKTWSDSKSWPTSCEGRRVIVLFNTRRNCLFAYGWYAYIYWISTLSLLNFLMFHPPLCTQIKHKYVFGQNIIRNSENLNCYIMWYSPI